MTLVILSLNYFVFKIRRKRLHFQAGFWVFIGLSSPLIASSSTVSFLVCWHPFHCAMRGCSVRNPRVFALAVAFAFVSAFVYAFPIVLLVFHAAHILLALWTLLKQKVFEQTICLFLDFERSCTAGEFDKQLPQKCARTAWSSKEVYFLHFRKKRKKRRRERRLRNPNESLLWI